MRQILLLAAVLLTFAPGCKKVEEVTCPTCSKDSACSVEFRYYSVRVSNEAGNPIVLDRFETIAPNGKALTRNITQEELTLGNTTGYYPLVDDRQRGELSTCDKEYEFRGYANNVQLASRKFRLRDDCCHVNLVSGDQHIILLP